MSDDQDVLGLLQSLGLHPASGIMGSGNVLCHCPFHQDLQASFSFHAGRGLWKCFSCGRAGSLKTLTEILGKGNPNWTPSPIFSRAMLARRELDVTFRSLNHAICTSPAHLIVKEWLWDRLDQLRGLVPSPERGADLEHFDSFALLLAHETIDIRATIGACTGSEYDLDIIATGPYYRRRWAVREDSPATSP